MEMGTSWRHNRILSSLQRFVLNLFWDDYVQSKIFSSQEQLALCYYGNPEESGMYELVDIDDNDFSADDINLLKVVQPDYMLFINNNFMLNSFETRIAGKPDLIVEVWSKDNKPKHRYFKETLYSTSSITEHWYIEQDSNNVRCMLGKNLLPKQSLKDVLITQNNIKIDLRHLAI